MLKLWMKVCLLYLSGLISLRNVGAVPTAVTEVVTLDTTTNPTTTVVTEIITVGTTTAGPPTTAGTEGTETTTISNGVVLSTSLDSMTNPDNKEMVIGGGQNVEVTITVSCTSSSVSGSDNWAISAFGSNSSTGSYLLTTSFDLTLASGDEDLDVTAGNSITFSGASATIDFGDISSCDDLAYVCVQVAEGSSASWTLDDSSSDIGCISITCVDGANFLRSGFSIMLLGLVLNKLLA